jgi:hypothetical protein
MPIQRKSYERQPIISTLDGDTVRGLMQILRIEYNLSRIVSKRTGDTRKTEILQKTLENLRRIETGSAPYHYQTDPNVLIGYLSELEKLEDPLIPVAVVDSFGKYTFRSVHSLGDYQLIISKYYLKCIGMVLKRPKSHEKNA